MALDGGPQGIYRASNDARDMSQHLLDRGREQQQGPDEWAEARVRCPGSDSDSWQSVAGPAIPETPRWPRVKLPPPDPIPATGRPAGPER